MNPRYSALDYTEYYDCSVVRTPRYSQVTLPHYARWMALAGAESEDEARAHTNHELLHRTSTDTKLKNNK